MRKSLIGFPHFYLYNLMKSYSVAFCTVQLVGIPLFPVVQLDIDAALTNVPLAATPFTQFNVQLVADMSVARQVIELRFVQPWNISL